MIKATELRIGNIVGAGILFNDEGEQIGPMPSRVMEIYDDEIKWTGNLTQQSSNRGGNSTTLKCVVGIPLTTDILRKCGFEYGETIAKCNSDDVNSHAWSMQISNHDWLEFQVVKGVQSPTMEPVTWPEWRIVNEFSWIRQDFLGQPIFLHQLQNLYFALTGKQLNIKL